MKRFFKIIFKTFGLIVVILVLMLASLPLLDNSLYKNILISSVRSFTGRELAVDGEMAISLYPEISFTVNNIHFQNAEWGGGPNMVSAEQLQLKAALLPLIEGKIDTSLKVKGADVLIELNREGSGNWKFESEKENKEQEDAGENKAGLFKLVRLDTRFSDCRLKYVDRKNKEKKEVDISNLYVLLDKEGILFDFSGVTNNMPIDMEGRLSFKKASRERDIMAIKGDIKFENLDFVKEDEEDEPSEVLAEQLKLPKKLGILMRLA